MKLSDYNTEEGFDVICAIFPYVENIVTDDKIEKRIISFFEKFDEGKEAFKTTAEMVTYIIKQILFFVPFLLKERRESVLNIVAKVNKEEVDKIKSQNMMITIKQFKEIVSDSAFKELFTSQSQTGDATSSGSASEKTEN